jgi:hypothetical protein
MFIVIWYRDLWMRNFEPIQFIETNEIGVLHSVIYRKIVLFIDIAMRTSNLKKKKNLHGLSPRANYTDRATAACRRVIANLCG